MLWVLEHKLYVWYRQKWNEKVESMVREHPGILGHVLPSQPNYYLPSSSTCLLQLECHFQSLYNLLKHDHIIFPPCPPYHLRTLGKADHLFLFISHSYFWASRNYEKQNKAMAVGLISLIPISTSTWAFRNVHYQFSFSSSLFPFPIVAGVREHSPLTPSFPLYFLLHTQQIACILFLEG